MPFEPGADLGMLVGGVVVDDQVQFPRGRGLTIDLVEEADEFLMSVTRHALADDTPLQYVERGEQCRRAVALVDAMGRAARACDLGAATTADRCPMRQPNDLSRSLAPFDQDTTLIAVIEMSQ